ncbi:hypothetical protein Btru_057649 [Bulinus truncatus]|nr:hypothetical protein Btru_057649 [Bulinus truncatus]
MAHPILFESSHGTYHDVYVQPLNGGNKVLQTLWSTNEQNEDCTVMEKRKRVFRKLPEGKFPLKSYGSVIAKSEKPVSEQFTVFFCDCSPKRSYKLSCSNRLAQPIPFQWMKRRVIAYIAAFASNDRTKSTPAVRQLGVTYTTWLGEVLKYLMCRKTSKCFKLHFLILSNNENNKKNWPNLIKKKTLLHFFSVFFLS